MLITFMQHMVKAMRDNKMDQFKKFYRSLDALLVDDIQFFAEKEKTQEEIFSIFSTIYLKLVVKYFDL